MKQFILLIFISCLFFSCKTKAQEETSIIRPAYSSYQLGMPVNEAFRLTIANQLANNLANNRKYSYDENVTEDGKKYYSKVQLLTPPADTMLLGLKVAFAVNQDDLKDAFHEGTPVQLLMPDNPGIWETEIEEDVIKKVSSTYGQYDSKDTLENSTNVISIRYKWKNRNDVDITLDCRGESSYYNKPLYFYSVCLDYRYTVEMLQKINYRKSKY